MCVRLFESVAVCWRWLVKMSDHVKPGQKRALHRPHRIRIVGRLVGRSFVAGRWLTRCKGGFRSLIRCRERETKVESRPYAARPYHTETSRQTKRSDCFGGGRSSWTCVLINRVACKTGAGRQASTKNTKAKGGVDAQFGSITRA